MWCAVCSIVRFIVRCVVCNVCCDVCFVYVVMCVVTCALSVHFAVIWMYAVVVCIRCGGVCCNRQARHTRRSLKYTQDGDVPSSWPKIGEEVRVRARLRTAQRTRTPAVQWRALRKDVLGRVLLPQRSWSQSFGSHAPVQFVCTTHDHRIVRTQNRKPRMLSV